MSEKKIDLNLRLQDLRLHFLSVKENTDDEKPTRENKVELVQFDEDDNILELKYIDKLVNNAKINLELIAVLEVDGEISLKDIENIIDSDEVDDLAYPLLSEASHIISFITSKTEVIPIIVPPTIMDYNESENKNKE